MHVHRGAPDVQDQKLNSHSKLNCITACIQAANAGADEALMLDPLGFVATCNSTHFFIVRRGELWTSSGQYCIPGITRGNMIRLAKDLGIPVFEKQFSLYDVYGADEAFVTGTFAGLIPVRDDRRPPGAPPDVDGGVAGRRPRLAQALGRLQGTLRQGLRGGASEMTNIAMWSGPRNISTAMMYSFGNRPDCVAWDEPFYAFSLVHHGNDHPMRDEIIAAGDSDWDSLVAKCLAPAAKPVFYQKHMTHHMLKGYDRSWIKGLTNAFLIREPERVLASYTKKWSDVSLRDIGFVEQAEIFDMVADHLGKRAARRRHR